ncbi:MAG: alkaline phosphatase PhoX [Pseudomonadota bacterium]
MVATLGSAAQGNAEPLSAPPDAGPFAPVFDGYPTDDVLVISGFAKPDGGPGVVSPRFNGDVGTLAEAALRANATGLFGIGEPLAESADTPPGFLRHAAQDAEDQVVLAKGLSAAYVTRRAADRTDMLAFWPSDAGATHLITCVEGGRRRLADRRRLNPSVQRIGLRTGDVRTILRGMHHCDGIRRTPWGTILVTEETADGRAFEILDPLATTEHTLTARHTGEIQDAGGRSSTRVVRRDALPTLAWEGVAILPSGVVIAVDELRPGDWDRDGDGIPEPDLDGGAVYKFIPSVPHAGGAISSLALSPLSAGSTYALRISCYESNHSAFAVSYGQGCEVGNGSWVPVHAVDARGDADDAGAAGYYRPEDLHLDPTYVGEGVRFCWANTGHEPARNYGEVICGVDRAPLQAEGTGKDRATVVVNRFVEGDAEFNSMDNLAFQPDTGILYVIEDHENGDVWACLPDGQDRDIKSDGCIRVLSVVDRSAEPTGFLFSADGTRAYIAIQHSAE